MFANWYAELNLFNLATFPPVTRVSDQERTQCTQMEARGWKTVLIF